mmetsp:Transcript_23985/g.38547  ORF Transcript_23985/g.38547 Transcript_23985/m.38547 type:complete len:118 (+) Transcript_23985:195-548(+)
MTQNESQCRIAYTNKEHVIDEKPNAADDIYQWNFARGRPHIQILRLAAQNESVTTVQDPHSGGKNALATDPKPTINTWHNSALSPMGFSLAASAPIVHSARSVEICAHTFEWRERGG